MRQRGFTLIEVLVVAAIVITMAAVIIGLGPGSQPLAMRSAATQFDAVVAYARSLGASSRNGATIVFSARSNGEGALLPGFTARVYAGRPDAPDGLRAGAIAPMTVTAGITEATLGPPPFSLFFDSSGHVTGLRGAFGPGDVLPAEPPCPGPGTVMSFTFRDSRSSDSRTLACRQEAAGVPALP